MKEYYNIEIIKELVKLPSSILKDFVENPNKKHLHKDKDGNKFYYRHVIKTLKEIIKTGNGRSVVYNYKANNRQYAENGSQGLPSHIKALILDDDYRDYDMVNCHFNILANLCKKHKISYNHIKNYSTERDEFLKRNKVTKLEVIIWLFTDKPKPKLQNTEIINFINELREIKKQLLFKLDIKNENTENKKNPISSLICKVLCKEENEILEKVLHSFNIQDAVKMFDGFMTRQPIEIEKLEELTNYKWTIKHHEKIEIPRNIKNETEGLIVDWSNIYYNKNRKDWILNKYERGCELFHYNKNNGLWNRVNAPYEELRSDIRNGGMLQYIQSNDFLEDYENKDLSDLEKFTESFINKHSTITNLTSLVYDKLLYDWVENIEFNDIDHIINFKNKCYDLKQMKFIEKEREHYSTLSARYLDDRDEDTYDKLTKIIEDIHPEKENRETYLQLLSNSLSGKALEKCVFCNGIGANGKGLIHGGIMRSLLGNYYYTADNKTLIERSNGANQSLANLHRKRMVVFEEPDEKTPINFNMVKTMTGGKVINARGLYEKNDQTILSLLLFIECNKKPTLSGDTGNSMMRRLVDILFPSCFKEENDPTYNKEIHKVADPRLKDNKVIEELSSQMFHYLIDFMTDNNLNYDNLDKIKVSDSIFKRSKAYIDSNNTVLELVNEVCDPIPKEKIAKVSTKSLKLKDLYDKIKASETWSLSTNKFKRGMGKGNFYKEIKEKEEYIVESIGRDFYILNYKIKEEPTPKLLIDDDDDNNNDNDNDNDNNDDDNDNDNDNDNNDNDNNDDDDSDNDVFYCENNDDDSDDDD